MNAVEIEEAVSALAERPFDREEFPYQFLEAFGNKATTIKRLRTGASNKSDVGGVLQTSNIHLAVADPGEVAATLGALRSSPATTRGKAKFILATDGDTFEAEDLESGETVACAFTDFPEHFGFFLPLAGITTVKQVRDSAFDIRATSRLNRLYVELLKDNPDWSTAERRPDMNHFMARLIFCFFAEDTDIFHGSGLFTATVDQMSAKDSSNTHEVIAEIFRAMNTAIKDREAAGIRSWANGFPYVNGGLFSGSLDVPKFSRIARSYLLHIGNLKWTQINPDIFGSMIQAVADDEERGALGMHYTSRPNILKVLNPLFLDSLREQLAEAGDNPRKLLNLRNRMARIRVFDPACGSGNFLVIAYKEMREIEAEINRRRGEAERASDIPLTNFRGIELRDFPAEIARLALIIAEFQCDALYRGQKLALAEFLPLNAENWITCGNALRLDWLSICPPTGTGVKLLGDDLFSTPLDQAQIDFENEGGETYICGNPPYVGATVTAPKGATAEVKARLKQEAEGRKADLELLLSHRTNAWKSLDYVSGWFVKYTEYARHTNARCAFVATNSICQGEQVARLWPILLRGGQRIVFAHTSFKWKNLAAKNAGVSVVIVGLSNQPIRTPTLFSIDENGEDIRQEVKNINASLVAHDEIFIAASNAPLGHLQPMTIGNKPVDGGNLILSPLEMDQLLIDGAAPFVRPYKGAEESINGKRRFCIWLDSSNAEEAMKIVSIRKRLQGVEAFRKESSKELTQRGANTFYTFQQVRQKGNEPVSIIPSVSSENRQYLPVSLEERGTIVSNSAFAVLNPELWVLSILFSKIHIVWITTVCGKLETRIRYSNTLGWNTFPVPPLTEKNKADLTRCAEDILLARETHFPATIADLYDPETMPANLRDAHERNDEMLERIYIGRRFKNDTERLEKLFELYTKMTAGAGATKKRKTGAAA